MVSCSEIGPVSYTHLDVYKRQAMAGGRIVMGIVNMILIIGVKGSTYTLSAFLTAAFVTALPGIVIQLVTIPVILGILKKAGFSGD